MITLKRKLTTSKKTVKTKNIQGMCKGINKFRNSYQPRAYVIKKDDDSIIADTASLLGR